MTAPTGTYPRLVADIGGTNVRFGLVRAPGTGVTDIADLRCQDHAGPAEAARAYLEGLEASARPTEAIRLGAFAVATAIVDDIVQLTNSVWQFSQRATGHALGLHRLVVINDFEALALALPGLGAQEIRPIGTPLPDPAYPMAVLGPGTGLGVATVAPSRGGWVALAGEGGHATLAAGDDFEADLLRAARLQFPHVSAERFLSGIGLPVLYRAVCAVRGEAPQDLGTEAIAQRGLGGADPACTATLHAFCAFLGSFAGNVALTVGARGGVFISGGIVPRLGAFFDASRFRARFEAKGRFTSYNAAIATVLVTASYPALAGAANAIEQHLLAQGG